MRVGIFVVMVGRAAAGPETYEHCLVKEIAALDRETEYHVFCLNPIAAKAFQIDQENVHFHVVRPSIRWIGMSAVLPVLLKRARLDLLHATFTPPPICPVDYVFTMHGSVTFTHPEFYSPLIRLRLNHLIRRGLKKARLILCVSRFVQDEIRELFKISQDRLVTVYHGVGSGFRPLRQDFVRETLRRRYGIERPYILFTGKLHSNKNIVRLIEAFQRAREEAKQDIQLVLAGRKVWGSDGIDETIQRLRLSKDVLLVGHQSHEHLPTLYNGAMAFVFPSLWEGFGLPVMEAMACGAPVIASNVACLPEVTGGAALLVDPLSTDAIAEGMYRLLTDEEKRLELSRRGLARARCFRWDRAARRTIDAYRQSLGLPGRSLADDPLDD